MRLQARFLLDGALDAIRERRNLPLALVVFQRLRLIFRHDSLNGEPLNLPHMVVYVPFGEGPEVDR